MRAARVNSRSDCRVLENHDKTQLLCFTQRLWVCSSFHVIQILRWLRKRLNATARIILLGIIMDVIYQIIVLKTFSPVEALIIAVVLAFVPYLLFRGIITRLAQRPRASASAGPKLRGCRRCQVRTELQTRPGSKSG